MITTSEKFISNDTDLISALYTQLALMPVSNVSFSGTEITFENGSETYTISQLEEGRIQIQGSQGYEGEIFSAKFGTGYSKVFMFREDEELVFWVLNKDASGDYGVLGFNPQTHSRFGDSYTEVDPDQDYGTHSLNSTVPNASFDPLTNSYQNYFWINDVPVTGENQSTITTLKNLKLGQVEGKKQGLVTIGPSTWRLFYPTSGSETLFAFRVSHD